MLILKAPLSAVGEALLDQTRMYVVRRPKTLTLSINEFTLKKLKLEDSRFLILSTLFLSPIGFSPPARDGCDEVPGVAHFSRALPDE